MNLNDVMDELGTQLKTISDLRVNDWPLTKITPPAAAIAMPLEITFDETGARGSDSMTVPVVVLVGRPTDRLSRNKLAVYCAGSGASSVKQVLEAHDYTSCDSVSVNRIDFDVITVGVADYLAAVFTIDIFGSGL